jgi:hypothetical protein
LYIFARIFIGFYAYQEVVTLTLESGGGGGKCLPRALHCGIDFRAPQR